MLTRLRRPEADKGKADFTNFKRAVWHESFRKILESIKDYSYVGYSKKCGDEEIRDLYPFVAATSSDYEEQ